MAQFLEAPLVGTAFGYSLSTGETATYVEDGVTFTFSVVSGINTQLLAHPGYLDVYGAAGTVDLTFTQSGGAISFTGNPIIGLSTILGGTITALTTAGSHKYTQLDQNNSYALTGVKITSIRFTLLNGGSYLSLSSIISNIACFCAGTMIATPDESIPVENLTVGDTVSTVGGGETKVRWLGEQSVQPRFQHPAKIYPIRIMAGALGDGLPIRDLYVSADHALVFEGCLINAGALVNGTTIAQVAKMPMDGFTYYHIETDAHEVILAEGVPVETFIDYAARDNFTHTGEGAEIIAEMPLPRISSARSVPDQIRTAIAAQTNLKSA